MNPEDTIDPQTKMTPRRAARAVLVLASDYCVESTMEELLADPLECGLVTANADQNDELVAEVYTTLRNWHASRSTALAEENERLKNELAEQYAETFYLTAGEPKDGWYCSNAMGSANYAADRLVELGKFEARPDNKPGSRVRFFRPISLPPVNESEG